MIVVIGQEGSGTTMLIEIIRELGFTSDPYEDFLLNPEATVRVVSDYIRADQSLILKASAIVKKAA